MNSMTIKELQTLIKARDFNPELKAGYFMKLVEEVGELSEVIRKDKRFRGGDAKEVKGTIHEELYDVLYYVLALANVYEVDMEEAVTLKEELNKKRNDH